MRRHLGWTLSTAASYLLSIVALSIALAGVGGHLGATGPGASAHCPANCPMMRGGHCPMAHPTAQSAASSQSPPRPGWCPDCFQSPAQTPAAFTSIPSLSLGILSIADDLPRPLGTESLSPSQSSAVTAVSPHPPFPPPRG